MAREGFGSALIGSSSLDIIRDYYTRLYRGNSVEEKSGFAMLSRELEKKGGKRVDQKFIDALLERTLAEASKAFSDTQNLNGAGLWVPFVSGASLFAVCLVLGKWLF
ncbi:hypothetical protein J7382_17080 [Shimia sp. R11_0]|uniref:hypothetical protein n=1 Tax=Shimia sp. R11_0 TaxID=2821096 RepID=UPI001AD9B995|nr:hypothetical protein [Shimia sp. R11_0]MBO9479261.1 hypothetical protein [Shimia sp. R11_0]